MNRLVEMTLYLGEQSLAEFLAQLFLFCVIVGRRQLLLHCFFVHKLDLLLVQLRLCRVYFLDLFQHRFRPFFVNVLNTIEQLKAPLVAIVAIPVELSEVWPLGHLCLNY